MEYYLARAYDKYICEEDHTQSRYVEELQGELKDKENHPYQLYPHLEYNAGVLYYWRYKKLPHQFIHPQVKQALEKTVGYFDEIFNHYPEGRVSEKERFQFAEDAAEFVREHILPEYEKLVKESIRRLSEAIKEGKIEVRLGKGWSPSDLSPQDLDQEAQRIIEEKAKELVDRLEPKIERPDLKKAREAKKRGIKEGSPPLEPLYQPGSLRLRDLIRRNAKIQKKIQRQIDEYGRVFSLIHNLLQELTGLLENYLRKTRKPRYQGYFLSGRRPDLRRAMNLWRKMELEQPISRRDQKIMYRRILPRKREHRIVLVLDESGSMDEPKRTYALAGLLLFMEALSNLDIDYAIIGFSGVPIIHKDFTRQITPDERKELFEEISYFIPSGMTADSDALNLTIDLLKEEPYDVTRLIIMITDGEGNINTTGKTLEELQEEAEQENIKVIGVGLGEGITEVKNHYKNSIQAKDPQELLSALKNILERIISDSGFKSSSPLSNSLIPSDQTNLLSLIYLHLKERYPIINIRHLKRASKVLGCLLKNQISPKSAFFRAVSYGFIEEFEDKGKIREDILGLKEEIKQVFSDFTEQDLNILLPAPLLQPPGLSDNLNSTIDLLITYTHNYQLRQIFTGLQSMLNNEDKDNVVIPGLSLAYKLLKEEFIQELIQKELEGMLGDLEGRLGVWDYYVREAAVQALTPIYLELSKQGKITLSQLEGMLKDSEWSVRRLAVQVLGAIYLEEIKQGKEINLDSLKGKLRDSDYPVREAAVQALTLIYLELSKQGKITLSQAKEEMLDSIDINEDKLVAQALTPIYLELFKQGKIALSRLEEMRIKGDDFTRKLAVQVLGAIYLEKIRQGEEVDIGKIEGMFVFSWMPICEATAQALTPIYLELFKQGKLFKQGEISLSHLEIMRRDEKEPVRRLAVQVLGAIYLEEIKQGKQVNLSQLEGMLGDSDLNVRRATAQALGQIYLELSKQGKITLSQLEGMLKDSEWSVRQAAAQALVRILEELALNNQKDLTELLTWFSGCLDTPLTTPLKGSCKDRILITPATLRIGDISLKRDRNSKVPPCVFTQSAYRILETIALSYLLKHPLILFGPTSTGKSFLINWLALVLGKKHLSYTLNPYISKTELIGGVKPEQGRWQWQDGILLRAMKEGLWLTLEEINLAPSEVIEMLNDLLITGKLIYSENGQQKVIVPHPDFRLFATANPESYAQRERLSNIFLSRFKRYYQDELTERELSEILSDLFNIPQGESLIISRFHFNLSQQAKARIIARKEKDPYIFSLRDLIRLGRRIKPLFEK
ncbi:MAG TPA: VWA domain-containing protein, partial [Candidatus Omnitrophica bacterium]|nr:VWA domain-containing protein [Candidatus Omnitrophota bacterium]